MTRINWEENMSVGVKIMDDQHKILIDAINKFYNSVEGKSNTELMMVLLKKMRDYSIFHFNSEETLLIKHDYQGYPDHKKEHISFINKMDDLEERMNKGKLVISIELTTYIKSWLKNHIMIVDKQYTAFLNSKGVY